MAVTAAGILVNLLAVYFLVGVLIAVPFVVRGINGIDASAVEGSRGFRVLILPGAIALWPLVLRLWIKGGAPSERNAHRDAARAIADAGEPP